MKIVTEQIWRALYRMPFFLDLPGIVQHLKFRRLRGEYYDAFWRSAAAHAGAKLVSTDFGFHRLEKGGLTTFVRNGEVMLDSHLTLEIIGNKAMVYGLLREKGLPVPAHLTYGMGSLEKAGDFLDAQRRPVVVKPASGTGGGRGVTTGIKTLRELKKASRLAARFDAHLLVEEQIDGHSYRLLYLDGAFIDCVRRDPPVITGDGRGTIRKLIAEENKRRLHSKPVRALSPLQLDRDCRNQLRELKLKPSSRLQDGRTINVKRTINGNSARQNHRVADQVHSETVATCGTLVGDLGVALAGIDVICRDISKPLTKDNGFITEVNTTPGLHHHDLVAEPDSGINVGARVLKHVFDRRTGVMTFGNSPASGSENSDDVMMFRGAKPCAA